MEKEKQRWSKSQAEWWHWSVVAQSHPCSCCSASSDRLFTSSFDYFFQQMFSWTCLVDVEMGRTICKKHDEDIDNCPLQEGAGEKQVGDHNHSASWENEGSWRRLKTALGQAEESGSLFHTGVRSQ